MLMAKLLMVCGKRSLPLALTVFGWLTRRLSELPSDCETSKSILQVLDHYLESPDIGPRLSSDGYLKNLGQVDKAPALLPTAHRQHRTPSTNFNANPNPNLILNPNTNAMPGAGRKGHELPSSDHGSRRPDADRFRDKGCGERQT